MTGIDRWVERQGWLEGVGEFIQRVVGGLYGALGRVGEGLKDLAHGTRPVGHPLHPALTDVPLGAWVVAVLADLAHVAGLNVPAPVATFALLIGVLAGVPTLVSGYTDHHETYGTERRLATLHGLLMTAVFIVMLVSLVLRVASPSRGLGVAVVLAVVGVVVALFGGYLGGHLSFGLGTMVNRNAFTHAPEESFDVLASGELGEGAMKRVSAGEAAVLLSRVGGRVYAISAVCSHAGGPLDEGELAGDVVTCPWHGSRFCVRDGGVRRGPATFAQPVYRAVEEGGRIRVTSAG